MMKRVYVLAGQYRHFEVWCRQHDLSPRLGNVRYLSQPQQLWGLWYDECEFHYYETWQQNPNWKVLLDEIYHLKSKGSRPGPIQVRRIVVEQNDNFWYRLTKLDPALYRGLIVAGVALLATAGVAIAPQVPDSIVAFIWALSAIVQGVWTRGSVTANARVAVEVPDPVNEPHVVAPGEAVTTATNSEIIAAAKS